MENIRKKNGKRKAKRKIHKKLNSTQQQNSKKLVFIIHQTINNFFPDFFERIRQIEDYRKKSEYELVELITACIAMFIFKEGSRNAFNNDRLEENFQKNYEKLFKLRLPHMDTVDNVMRNLKENELEQLKTSMIRALMQKKSLHKFRLLGKYFVVAVDGTGIYSFSKRQCEHCLTKTSKNGKTTYFHNVLEAKLICYNGFSISLATEWIENPEGDFDKQDCEIKAFRRLAIKLKKLYPRLPICVTADGLYPTKTFFKICRTNEWRFIITFKDGNLPSVWKQIKLLKTVTTGNTRSQIVNCKKNKIFQNFFWFNNLEYQEYQLHCIECAEYSQNTNNEKSKTTRFVHLTDIEIIRDKAPEISQTGRLRWKIENEGFNIQKNNGYKLKHKYSRSRYCAAKNYYQCLQIAHLINQLVELSSKCAQLISKKLTIKHLWKTMIGFLIFRNLSTEELLENSKLKIQIRFE